MKKLLLLLVLPILMASCSSDKDSGGGVEPPPASMLDGSWRLVSVDGGVAYENYAEILKLSTSGNSWLYCFDRDSIGRPTWWCHSFVKLTEADTTFEINVKIGAYNGTMYEYEILQLTNDSLVLKETFYKYNYTKNIDPDTIKQISTYKRLVDKGYKNGILGTWVDSANRVKYKFYSDGMDLRKYNYVWELESLYDCSLDSNYVVGDLLNIYDMETEGFNPKGFIRPVTIQSMVVSKDKKTMQIHYTCKLTTGIEEKTIVLDFQPNE